MDEANLNQEAEKKGGKKRIGIWLIVALVLVLLGFNVYLLLSRREAPAETEAETRRNVVLDEENAGEMLSSLASGDEVEEGYYTVTMNFTWHFPTGDTASADAYVENLESNTHDVYFDLVLREDESEVLYQSPVIPRGHHLDNIVLDKPLDVGIYNCVCIYHLVDEDQNTVSTVRVTVTVVVDG